MDTIDTISQYIQELKWIQANISKLSKTGNAYKYTRYPMYPRLTVWIQIYNFSLLDIVLVIVKFMLIYRSTLYQ